MNTGWWIADLLGSGQGALLVSWAVWVIGAICLHELAHGWAAIRCGDDTPTLSGHMTWNPLVHMGPMSLLMFALVGIAWGAMPVTPYKMRGRHAEALVALAGPAMNIALAIGAAILGGIWLSYGGFAGDPMYQNVQVFFRAGVFLNLILAGFNLLPIPPLDGSRILSHYHRGYRELMGNPQAQTVAFIILIVIFFQFAGVLFTPARELAFGSIDVVSSILP